MSKRVLTYKNVIKQRYRTIILSAIILIVLTSYTISLIAFISPSQELRWNTAFQPITPTQYNKGGQVSLMGLLEEGENFIQDGQYFSFTSPESVTWAITIMDPNKMPVYFQEGTLADIQGNQQIPLTFNIPTDAASGTYTVKLIVWNAPLPSGNTRTMSMRL